MKRFEDTPCAELARLASKPQDPVASSSSLRPPYPGKGPALLASVALLGLACGGLVTSPREQDVGSIDLHTVQKLGAVDIPDGSDWQLDRADYSLDLVYGRSAGRSDSAERQGACHDDPRVLLGLVSLDTCIGADLFFREDFGGNGRTCSSCHPVANNFTLDPEFIATLPDDDPLFVAEREPELAALEMPQLMRDFALIVENLDGRENPSEKFVMRSVSHLFSMATSIEPGPVIPQLGVTPDGSPIPPLHRTGWSGDGAPGDGSLREFTTGAVEQHATRSLDRVPYTDFIPPTARQLDQIEKFQLQLGRTSNFDVLPVEMSDAGAQRGLLSSIFGGAQLCDVCHRNAEATNFEPDNLSGLANSNFDTGVETARLSILDELGIPRDGGFGTTPMDLDGDGTPDAFGNGKFNAQTLIEAADTGPFFHTNAVEKLEDVIRFYTSDAFAESEVGRAEPTRFSLTEQEIQDLGRFLRVLNAAFNCQIALLRVQAAFEVADAFGNQHVSVQRGLIELAIVELDDALDVLSGAEDLNLETRGLIDSAKQQLRQAQLTSFRGERKTRARAALVMLSNANDALGTNLGFELGEGTLMF